MNRCISIAPMMSCTDRHYRHMMGLITHHTVLYSEMITAEALRHRDPAFFLDHKKPQNKVALQLGGSDPQTLAYASRLGEEFGYDEINLNVGCPSERVQSGKIGACLMAEPKRVAQCLTAMQQAVTIPVTIKHRTGIDDQDSYEQLHKFVDCITNQSPCQTIVIHARKAWLKGVSPRANRIKPPLQYDYVNKIKQDFPNIEVIINGGIQQLTQAQQHLKQVDGVMIGRAAYDNPYLFAEVDAKLFKDNHQVPTRKQVLENMIQYIEKQTKKQTKLQHITRHMMGLFQGQPHAKQWRRLLTNTNTTLQELRQNVETLP